MARHNVIGNQGEILAVMYLKSQGYTILETNWRFDKAEIDIIAQNEETLVICEVKTRSSKAFGKPETFVTDAKQKLLIKAAEAYIQEQQLDLDTRFDIIAITGDDLEHIEGAFYPEIG